MDARWEILVALSDLKGRQSIVTSLALLGVSPFCASSVSQCREVLEKQNVGLIFCARRFADGTYRDVMGLTSSSPSRAKTRLVLTTSFIEPEEYHEARRAGVFDVIALPCHSATVEWMVIRAVRELGDPISLIRSADVTGLSRTPQPACKMSA